MKKYNPGIHQISNAEYHAAHGLSRSALWKFKQLPYKYWYQYLSGEYEEKESEAQVVGNLLHTLVLEPEKFEQEYFAMPKINRTTKQGKLDYEAALNEANGRVLVKPDHLLLAKSMQEKILANDLAVDIITDSKIEQSIFWKHSETELLCKSRPDIWKGGLVADLKTTTDATYRSFQMSAFKYGYFLQAAMTHEALKSVGVNLEKFVFICIEKEPPHSIGIYLLDDEALAIGLNMYHNLLNKYKECLEQNNWPDYGVQTLTVPNWATSELLDYA